MAEPCKLPPPIEALDCLAYDPGTGSLTWRRVPPGSRVRIGEEAGSLKRDGYRTVLLFGRYYQAHRLAWFITHGKWPASLLDHINGNKADNRLANLREATPQQNSWNRAPIGALPKGVCFHKGTEKFQASLQFNHRSIYLGLFETPEEAHRAWRSAAEDVQGQFLRVDR